MRTTMSDGNEALLTGMLELAVMAWTPRLQATPWSVLRERMAECGRIIAEKGDNILYKSKKKGESAKAFNAMAEAVTILSFAPGGIKIFGMHFENTHPELTRETP